MTRKRKMLEVVALVLTLASCKLIEVNPLVGEWWGGVVGDVLFVFRTDMTFGCMLDESFDVVSLSRSGTYVYTDSVVTFHFDDGGPDWVSHYFAGSDSGGRYLILTVEGFDYILINAQDSPIPF